MYLRNLRLVAVIFCLMILPGVCFGAPGDLDTSFGDGGVVITDFSNFDDRLEDVSIDTDSKILAVGYSNYDFAVVRYNSSGALDTNFGNNGKIIHDIGGLDLANCLDIQADGSLVVAGVSVNSTQDFAITRYNSSGILDPSFGGGGVVLTDFGSSGDVINEVVIQNDGKILAAGFSNVAGDNDFAIARYNSTGVLDSSFSEDGILTTDLLNVNGDERAYSAVIQPDGKILTAGVSGGGFTLVRYNSTGVLDSSFGSAGVVTTDFGDSSYANKLALQSDGKIVAVGIVRDGVGENAFAIARYNSTGILDTSFSTDGIATTDFGGNDTAEDVSIQPDGKIVVVGNTNFYGSSDIAIVRYNIDGSLDTSFGINGKLVYDISNSSSDPARSLALQSDGRILWAGFSDANGTNDFALARFDAFHTVARPQKIFVPTGTNTTGNLQVSWFDSATPGVDYLVECQLSPDGIDWTFQDWYGCATTPNAYANFYDLPSGFHHRFRVKAYKADYHDSTYVTSVPVLVEYTVAAPRAIYLPPGPNTTGSIQVSWEKSSTPDVLYVLEQSYGAESLPGTQGPFFPVAEYTDPTLTYANITGLIDGFYIYRVSATKTGYSNSSYTATDIYEVALDTQAKAPRKIFVDTNNISSGLVQVSWSESKTTGATYVLEQSDNGGGTWTPVTSTAQTYANVSGLASGSYLFRVKTTATGYSDSAWTTSGSVNASFQVEAPRRIWVDSKKNSSLVEVSWWESSTPGATYVVDMSDDDGQTWFNYLTPSPSTSFRPTGVGTGTYIARVKAVKTGYADSDWVVSKSFDVQ